MEADQSDYHTAYVVAVDFHHVTVNRLQCWQILMRYNRFKTLYYQLTNYLPRSISRMPEFPLASLGDWMFGISDTVRNERMKKMNSWLQALLMNPVLMTIAEVVHIVFEFLQVDENIPNFRPT